MLTSFHSCHLMPSIWGIILKVYLCWVLVFNGTMNVLLRCLSYSLDSSPPRILRYMPNSHPSMLSPRMDVTYFGMIWNSLFLGLTPWSPSNNPTGYQDINILEFGRRHELYLRLQAKKQATSPPAIARPCFSKQLPPPSMPTSSPPSSLMLIPTAIPTMSFSCLGIFA